MTDPTPASADVIEGMREALEDVRTHKNAWREALVETRDRAVNDYPDINNTGYWQHELDVFDRVTGALALPDSKPDNQGGD